MKLSQAIAAIAAMSFTLPGLCQGPAQQAAPPVAPSAPVETPAPESPPPEPGVDNSVRLQQVRQAIAEQERRRSTAKGGYITAGVVLGVGVVATAVLTANDAEEAEQEAYENGESTYEVKINWTGVLVGALIAVPIALTSVNTMQDANIRLRELNHERVRLGLAPGTGGDAGATLLTLRYEF